MSTFARFVFHSSTARPRTSSPPTALLKPHTQALSLATSQIRSRRPSPKSFPGCPTCRYNDFARVPADEVLAGDICAVTGVQNVGIGDTICSKVCGPPCAHICQATHLLANEPAVDGPAQSAHLHGCQSDLVSHMSRCRVAARCLSNCWGLVSARPATPHLQEFPVPLPTITIEDPTLSMSFMVNTSPFAGREGKFVTS